MTFRIITGCWDFSIGLSIFLFLLVINGEYTFRWLRFEIAAWTGQSDRKTDSTVAIRTVVKNRTVFEEL